MPLSSYGLASRGTKLGFPAEANEFSFFLNDHIGDGAHPSIQQMDSRGPFLGIKQQEHKPPFNSEVKNIWRYISIFPHVFMEWCSIYCA
jgi:hypothetical protein